MPTPIKGYFLKSGEKVPGVTTIIGRFKDSGALMHWAFKQGKEGKARLYEEAEKAADIGTVAHAMVEAHIKLTEPPQIPPGMDEKKVLSAFNAYCAWAAQTKLVVLEQEMQLVSEKYCYGGTPDAIGMIGNELCLLDWKTSNGVYEDYLFQLAAYRNLWEENYPERPLTGGFHLLRFAKEHADFGHHYYANLDEQWRGFVLMRELYDICKETKRRAA